ncbi:MAG: colicin V production protein [Chloroflexus sp.]|uniref:CvpA family protein n=1 Tax=Chloroflexus sp. TaxID=1904827 RepID=UPI0021DCC4C0|nr:CvpA family protein [Chloroflexus sp.]GIV90933.1 MAG: colicin V production protein [Chloroflexus sp.]
MNVVDLFFVILFFGALAAGFFQGTIRLVLVILAFYFSTVIASLYYQILADIFVRELGGQRFVSQYVAFALIHLLCFVVLTIVGIYSFRYVQTPHSIEMLDRIVGSVLGVVVGGLAIGLTAVLLWNLFIVRGLANIDYPITRWLGGQIGASFMLRFFANAVLPSLYDLIDPILPDAARIIFQVQ